MRVKCKHDASETRMDASTMRLESEWNANGMRVKCASGMPVKCKWNGSEVREWNANGMRVQCEWNANGMRMECE